MPAFGTTLKVKERTTSGRVPSPPRVSTIFEFPTTPDRRSPVFQRSVLPRPPLRRHRALRLALCRGRVSHSDTCLFPEGMCPLPQRPPRSLHGLVSLVHSDRLPQTPTSTESTPWTRTGGLTRTTAPADGHTSGFPSRRRQTRVWGGGHLSPRRESPTWTSTSGRGRGRR